MKHSLLVMLSFLWSLASFAQTGTIRGQVVDQRDGQPLIGATVILEGTTQGSATDIEGKFTINKVNPGTYNLKVSFISYSSTLISNVEVKAGQVTLVNNIFLSDADTQLDVVTVEAEALKSNEDFILLQRKKSAGVIDGISAEKIAQTGDINAAAAIRRVTGVSIEGGKYVYVRGVGDRYTQTLLNGLQIPGLDPERNTVQLDLIPSQLLSNIVVKKTFTPDLPGTSTGGTINIVTSDFPDQFTVNISARVGYNTQASLNDNFVSYVGGGTDWLAIDDGTRDFPESIDIEARGEDIPVLANIFSNPDVVIPILRDQTLAFNTNFDPIRDSQPLDHRFAFSVGNQTVLGDNVTWGYQASASYVREYEFRENNIVELYQVFQAPNAVFRYRDDQGTENVLWGGLITTGFKFGKKNKINANFLYNRGGEKTSIERQGELSAEQRGDYQNFSALLYEERALSSYQVFGSHFIGNDNQLNIEWSGAYTDSQIEHPDWRFFSLTIPSQGDVVLNDFFNEGTRPPISGAQISPSDGFFPSRFYRFLDESNINAKVDLTYTANIGKVKDVKFKAGANYLFKDREFTEFSYRYESDEFFITGDTRQSFLDQLYLPLLFPDTIPTRNSFPGVYIQSNFRSINSYEADQTTIGAYLMTDFTTFSNKLRVVAGARIEITELFFTSDANDDIAETTFLPLLATLDDAQLLDDIDILPSLNLTYNINEKMALRLAYSRTVARPSFRELAPYRQAFVQGGTIFAGNQLLERSQVDNFDLRYDFYPTKGGELYSISVFYKRFDKPIERFIIRDGGEQSPAVIVPANVIGDPGTLFGVEAEVRKNLGFMGNFFSDFTGGINATYIVSDIEGQAPILLNGTVATEIPADRRLQDQPTYTLNIFLNYTKGAFESNLNFNVQGNAINLSNSDQRADRTDLNIPDVLREPRPELNFNCKYTFKEVLSIRFSANNLINPEFAGRYDTDIQDLYFENYRAGRTFALGVAYKIN